MGRIKKGDKMDGFETRVRLWDKRKKIMLPSAPLYKVDFSHVDTSNYILMFGTGRPDKNGKKIYQGDTCSYGDVTSDGWMLRKERTIGVVNYIPDRCALMLQEIRENHKGGHYIAFWDFLANIEITGHIYEESHD